MSSALVPIPTSPGRGAPAIPKQAQWRSRFRALVAGLLSLLLVATAVAPATAALLHDGSQKGGGLLVTNWYTQGSHRDKWFGGWERSVFTAAATSLPGSGGNTGLAYCIEMGPTAGQIPADGWRQDTSDNAKRLAWIIHHYGGLANNNTAAAVSVAAYRYAYPAKSQVNTVEWNRLENQFFSTGAPNKAIGDLATQYWNESAAHLNLRNPSIEVAFHETNFTRARVTGIGIQNTANTWLAGYPYTITLEGGMFSNGSTTYTGTTTAEPFVRDVFVNTGERVVKADISFTNVAPGALWLGEHATLQDSVTTTAPRSFVASAQDTHPDTEAFRPAVETRAVSEVVVGQQLTDSVDFTFTHDNDKGWPEDEVTETPVPVQFQYAIYGPFTTLPTEAPGVWPSGLPVFQGWTNYTRTTGAGNNVEFTSTSPVTTEGYYTWVWRMVARGDQTNAETRRVLPVGYSYMSGILHAETTLASTPTVTTAALPAVVHGTPITDTATITGLVAPGTQIEFELWRQGDGGLNTDTLVTTTARQAVAAQGAGGTQTVTSSAVGPETYGDPGTFYWRERLINNTTVLHYGAPRLPGETTLVAGVSTTALAHANHGDDIYDVAHLVGTVPAGSHLVFELWRQGDGEVDTDVLVTTTDPVAVDEAGDYTSPSVGADVYGDPGTFYWVEHLFTPANPDSPFTSGEPRLPNETTLVSRLTTTALEHGVHGTEIYDVAHLEGSVPADSHLVFELWRQGEGDLDTDELVTTVGALSVDGAGEYKSTVVDTTGFEVGTYYWREVLSVDGEVLHYGAARVEAESFELSDTPDTPDVPDVPDTPDVPDLPRTGFNPGPTALLGGVLLLGGFGLLSINHAARVARAVPARRANRN